MSSPLLLVEKREGVCTLTLNRPEKRNALNPELLLQLRDTFHALLEDEDTRVVVLRGAGEMAFSAGYDVTRLEEEAARRQATGQGYFDECMSAIGSYPRPVLAMVFGFAMGGGLQLAMACDLRLAAENAKFAYPAARMGQADDYDLLLPFLNAMGPSRAKEFLFTGRTLDAAAALEMGLVSLVVPAERLASVTYEMAQEIAAGAPLTVYAIKFILSKVLEEAQRPSRELATQIDELVLRVLRGEDAREGPRAFLEKRKPNFTGR